LCFKKLFLPLHPNKLILKIIAVHNFLIKICSNPCNVREIDVPLHSTAQHSTAQHSTAQHSTAQLTSFLNIVPSLQTRSGAPLFGIPDFFLDEIPMLEKSPEAFRTFPNVGILFKSILHFPPTLGFCSKAFRTFPQRWDFVRKRSGRFPNVGILSGSVSDVSPTLGFCPEAFQTFPQRWDFVRKRSGRFPNVGILPESISDVSPTLGFHSEMFQKTFCYDLFPAKV
jgi:hypothetical protein